MILLCVVSGLGGYTLFMEDPAGGHMDSSGGSNSISVGGESTMGGGSSRGSGWTSFDLDVLAEPSANENERGEEVAQPNPPNALDNPIASPGAAQEALPQAPAQAEGAQPAPNLNEISALKGQIHALIQEQVRKESEKRMGPLSIHFPQQREIYSQTTQFVIRDLELSTETDTGLLRQWVQKLQSDQKRLQ